MLILLMILCMIDICFPLFYSYEDKNKMIFPHDNASKVYYVPCDSICTPIYQLYVPYNLNLYDNYNILYLFIIHQNSLPTNPTC